MHQLTSPVPDQQFLILNMCKKHLTSGGDKRIQYTLPSLVFRAMELCRVYHDIREEDGKWEKKVCTLYKVHCTKYIVQSTLYIVQSTLYIVQSTLYIVQSTLYIVQNTLYIVQSTLYIVQRLCSIYCGTWNKCSNLEKSSMTNKLCSPRFYISYTICDVNNPRKYQSNSSVYIKKLKHFF